MSYQPKVYRTDGGDKLVVASGGTIDVQSGATFTIADGSLETPDLALAEGNVIVGNNAGKGSALNAKTTTQILVGNGTTITSVALSGDVTMTNAGVVAIAADSIINADVKTNAAIDFSKLAALDSANLLVGSSTGVATKRAITGDIGITNEGVTSITADSIVDADVNAAAAIAYSKLATLDSAYLVVGDNAGVPTKREVTGDVTISNTGVTTIGVGAVEDSMIEGLAAGQIILGVDGSAANNLKSTLSGDVSMDATGAVTIANGAVEDSMIEGLAAGAFIVGADGTAANNAKVTMSGDVTMAAGGAVTIGAGRVTSSMLVNGAGLASLLAAGGGASAAYDKTTAGAQTLLAANAALAGNRIVLLVVVVDETFAAGDNAATVFDIGETDTPNKFKVGLNAGTAGDILIYAGVLLEEKALLITGTAALGTGTGGISVTVLALPETI